MLPGAMLQVSSVGKACAALLHAGNVARFINHSCDPNLLVQVVFTQGCSSLKYRVALVAKQ